MVRPVREQFEHDRVIRLLQPKWRRRGTVAVNVGGVQETPVRVASQMLYPDLVVQSGDGGRRVTALAEVETGESVNHLEAMAQWVPFGKVRAPFSLFVPAGASDAARRLCADYSVRVAEIWTYHLVGDQLRVTMVYRAPAARAGAKRAVAERARASSRQKGTAAKSRARKTATRTPARPKPTVRKRAAAPRSSARATRPVKKSAPRAKGRPAAPKRARTLRRK